MERYICIHGHFYQPPRENPWLEAVELQDSAYPYHDWNERISAECYAPNATARLLDEAGRIDGIQNNYSRISFNFGPTLLAWMQEKDPDVLALIVEADRLSREHFSGHGSALAQCYNHLIMPLANDRDKQTQVLWGRRDFETRFGREPEGMWLPETAADDDSLEALAAQGIKFTILSPFQASRIRRLGEEEWTDINGGRVESTRPYLVNLPSGRSLTVFFYDAPASQAVAFERLLTDGHNFAHRLVDAFADHRDWDQLVHIATDGESYGHHFRYGEMALAYALRYIEQKNLAKLTNYGEYLERHPPAFEAQIHQKSAWSCSHGVERWKSHCGCNSGRGGWNQHWRGPLRQALDWLRDELAPRFESRGREFFKDPWAARDDYISVILDRSHENCERFFARHANRPFSSAEHVAALRLLEMQRHALLMYTSCGWFFDEISGIETVQVIQYAARAIQLANDLLGEDFEEGFRSRLAMASSNLREYGDGRQVYERFAKPAIMNREKVAVHYAVSSLFESYPEQARIYSFTFEQQDRQLYSVGNARLAIGRIKVLFEITHNFDVFIYGVLHLGDHNLNCGVRLYQGPESYSVLSEEMRATFERADFPQIIRLMDRHFGDSTYSLKHLFRDEQRKVVQQILAHTLEEVHNTYRLITDRHTPLLRFLADSSAPAPRALTMPIEFVLNADLRKQFSNGPADLERVRALLAECASAQVPIDSETLGYALQRYLEQLSADFDRSPDDLELLRRFVGVAELARQMPFEPNLWKTQNTYYLLRQHVYPAMRVKAAQQGGAAVEWLELFQQLGRHLNFRVQAEEEEPPQLVISPEPGQPTPGQN